MLEGTTLCFSEVGDDALSGHRCSTATQKKTILLGYCLVKRKLGIPGGCSLPLRVFSSVVGLNIQGEMCFSEVRNLFRVFGGREQEFCI